MAQRLVGKAVMLVLLPVLLALLTLCCAVSLLHARAGLGILTYVAKRVRPIGGLFMFVGFIVGAHRTVRYMSGPTVKVTPPSESLGDPDSDLEQPRV